MPMVKTGAPGDGAVIGASPELAKLGSRIRCGACGAEFVVRRPEEFARRLCPKCRADEGPRGADGQGPV